MLLFSPFLAGSVWRWNCIAGTVHRSADFRALYSLDCLLPFPFGIRIFFGHGLFTPAESRKEGIFKSIRLCIFLATPHSLLQFPPNRVYRNSSLHSSVSRCSPQMVILSSDYLSGYPSGNEFLSV